MHYEHFTKSTINLAGIFFSNHHHHNIQRPDHRRVNPDITWLGLFCHSLSLLRTCKVIFNPIGTAHFFFIETWLKVLRFNGGHVNDETSGK